MNKKEYLTEERYKKVNNAFKTLYLILSIIGIIMVVAGIVILILNKNINYFSTQKLIASSLIIIGIALSILSIGDLLRHTFARDIVSYYVQQKMPITKEGIEEMAPTVGVAAKEITKGIKDGLKNDTKK